MALAAGPGGADDQRPLGMDLPRRVKALVLAGSMLAMFMSALEQGIVGPALPRIVSELGGLELYPWLFQACITAQVVAIPVAARLSARIGRKRVLVAGLAIFLAGSAAAPDIYSLIAFRAVQGAGAGILAVGPLNPSPIPCCSAAAASTVGCRCPSRIGPYEHR